MKYNVDGSHNINGSVVYLTLIQTQRCWGGPSCWKQHIGTLCSCCKWMLSSWFKFCSWSRYPLSETQGSICCSGTVWTMCSTCILIALGACTASGLAKIRCFFPLRLTLEWSFWIWPVSQTRTWGGEGLRRMTKKLPPINPSTFSKRVFDLPTKKIVFLIMCLPESK